MFKNLQFLLLLICLPAFGQTTYSGFIDKYPIELVTYIHGDGDARAIYAYKKYDTPIIINGRLKGDLLILSEKNNNDVETATLTFTAFDKDAGELEGIWKDAKTGKQLKISLVKEWDVDTDKLRDLPKVLLQAASTTNRYFRQQVYDRGDGFKRIIAVNVYEKKTDKLLQSIYVDCQLWGLQAITVDDYNFDGHSDFSVFESSYAGANTTSLYFLYNPENGKYFNSGFEGTSLEFDKNEKKIYERNSCCGGTEVMTAVYRVENNKMILVERHCYKYDEEKDDYFEEDCGEY